MEGVGQHVNTRLPGVVFYEKKGHAQRARAEEESLGIHGSTDVMLASPEVDGMAQDPEWTDQYLMPELMSNP